MNKTKFIFITGGVVSSLGKGLASASLASILQARGFKVRLRKLDPYLNVDPGTMSPYQHGEVFVTDDGTEAWRVLERSAENVSGRHLYDFREPCGTSGNYASLRNGSERTPDRFTAHRRLLCGEKNHPRGIHLRADQKLRTQSVGTMTVGG